MLVMYIATQSPSTALDDWFKYYFNTLKVGIITSIVGSSHLKAGVGKSYSAIRMGEKNDPDYRNGTEALDKIVFRPREFAKAMELVESKKRAGQVVVIDEAGILVNSKKWYAFINRSVSDAVMTFRQLRGMAIFVSPYIGSIEKDIRLFVSHLGFCNKVVNPIQSPGNDLMVKLYFYKLYWDETKSEYYKYRLAMYVRDLERVCKFKYFKVNHVQNKELIEEYEKKSSKYKREIRASIMELEAVDRTFSEYVTQVMNDSDLIKETIKGKKVYPEDINENLGVTFSKARMIARRVNEKLANGESLA